VFIVFCTRALSFLRKSPAISAKEPYKDYTSTSSQPTKGLACFVITIALQSCVSISTKELCYIRKRALPYVQKSPIKATHRRGASPQEDLQALSSQLLCSRVYRFPQKSPAICAKEACKDYSSTSSQPTRRFAGFVITVALQSCISFSAKDPWHFCVRALPYLHKRPVKTL